MLAHGGMVETAQYVLKDLQERNILSEALSRFEGYTLLVTGHSLGAGAAAVLAFWLRRNYPDIICYAYSPPCIFNNTAAEASKAFVTSVTLGEDLVGRLSISALLRLKNRMRSTLVNCELPKYKVGNSI